MLIDDIYLQSSPSFTELRDATADGKPSAAFGVLPQAKRPITAALFDACVYVARDGIAAQNACEELALLTGKRSVYLPPKDDVLLYKKAFNKDNFYRRIAALYDIVTKKASYICTTMEGLLQLAPNNIPSLRFSAADEYPLDLLIKKLVKMGYTRGEFVTAKGEFAVRGDIVEIFPINSDLAYRCDFFGDEIEKLRIYDAASKKATDEVSSFTVIAANDFFIEDSEADEVKKSLLSEVKKLVPLAQIKAKRLALELGELLDVNPCDASLTFLMPLLNCAKNSVLSLIPSNFAVVFDEPKLSKDTYDFFLKDYTERALSLQRTGEIFKFAFGQFHTLESFIEECRSRRLLALQNLTVSVPYFNPLKTVRFNCTAISRYALNPGELATDLFGWKKNGYRVIICAGSGERAKKLYDSLTDGGIAVELTERPLNNCGVYITSRYLGGGFIIHDNKLVVIGTADLFAAVKKKKTLKRRNETFEAPDIGDFAVHEKHGIGIVRGVERISTMDGAKDYVAVEYSGGDYLYVPVEDADKLTKYLGGDKAPQLNRIGGVEFEKVKERVRESISRMSINLRKLYKERASAVGFCFASDDEMAKAFDDAFEFDETEDQLRSIAEIKHDMESDKVMDRLLCGDVGYGKTEVALRAAFKAVMSGKQVALLAPTTILTEQHYNTCRERFHNFGVSVGVLNRFRKPIQIKDTLKKLASGELDIVIGTHKLLSKDVVFKDLGLLILDEEQCFGVEHKEKLRTLKKNVDTLTMTATPIPRTLHMSLSGIRDISLINTPPVSRIPVQAYVFEESEGLIRDAVIREISRGGQVFILYNKVDSIASFSAAVASLIPEAKVIYGHGQMQRETLENNILAFYRGEYNVLVSTTIIENGIDLPTANTLIVTDADKLGLFTLYQLKGRVGRSDRMAYAYFTYKEEKVLTDTAYKRLSALMEHTELGSGYKIAMRDLEIRGAGNVLGREQHGHMDKIGYELYAKLLREELGDVQRDFETELDIKMDAYIPDKYIEVSASRLSIYKMISEIKSEDDAKTVAEEITESYGDLPKEINNLISIALLKHYARLSEVTLAKLSNSGAELVFKDVNSICGGVQVALREAKDAVLSFAATPKISFRRGSFAEETLAYMTNFLIISLKNQKND